MIDKVFGTMDIIKQTELFLKVMGGSLVGGELIAYYLKNKARNKLANGHLISKNDITDILGNDGLILSKDIQLKEKYDFEGSVVFGSTGSGKSTSFFVPNLLSNNIKGSIVVTDPKSELYTLTSGYQKEVCKRRVIKFSPLEPQTSEKYNLLTSCKNNVEVIQLAQSLIFNGSLSIELTTGKKVGGAEWTQMATPYLAAALFYCKDLEYPFNTIEFAFNILITLNMDELGALFNNSKNINCKTQWNMIESGKRADRTIDSIRISFATNMQLFADERINQATDATTFDFESFRKEPTILYITYPAEDSKYIAPFTAPFFNKMLNTFVKGFNKKSLSVTILADEFANIGMISSMNSLCSYIRSAEISMNICLQGLTQLTQIYGKENAMTILNNLKTKIILPSMSDQEALNYISFLCGEKEIETISKSENKSGASTNYNKTKIRMFSESDLRCLKDDELLLVTSNKQPILTKKNIYFKNDEYVKNIKNPVEVERKPLQRYDLLDHIQDLKIDLAIEKEEKYDIRKELLR